MNNIFTPLAVTPRAATPAVVAVAMPRSRGANQRLEDVASEAYIAEVEGAARAHDRH